MNKFLLFIVLLGVTVSTCFAQTKSTTDLSIGSEFGLPTGQASGVYGSVFGASIKLEVPVFNPKLKFVVTAGVTDFFTKFYYAGSYSNALYLPVEVGAKYYFSKIGYFEGDVGASTNLNNNAITQYTTSKLPIVFSPVIGFTAPKRKSKNTIDIGLRYENWIEKGGSIGQVAVRLAYRFGI